MRRLRPLALLLALAVLLPPGAARAQGGTFAHLEVVDGWGRPLPKDAPVRVVLELSEGAGELPGVLPRRFTPAPAVEGGALVVADLRGERPDTSPALPRHRKPSFVLDYDEPAFAPLLAEARASLGPKAAPAALARFVHGYVKDKNTTRNFDVASRVARAREGDCSEHAVLLAALARAEGHAARVVQGLVLVREGEKLLAVGHAWVEVRGKKAWEVVDGALPPEVGARYVPLGVLDVEGPGFTLALLSSLGPSHVRRVRVEPLATAGSAAP
jgi:transglutaminase-like putative cysteine protease